MIIRRVGAGLLTLLLGLASLHGHSRVEQLLMVKRAQKSLSFLQLPTKLTLLEQEQSLAKELGLSTNKNHGLQHQAVQVLQLVADGVPLLIWQLITLLCLLLFLLCFAGLMPLKSWKHPKLFLTIILMSSCMTWLAWPAYWQQTALVMASNVQVLSGPDESYPALYNLRMGQQVEVLAEKKLYLKVKDDKNLGWVLQADMARL